MLFTNLFMSIIRSYSSTDYVQFSKTSKCCSGNVHYIKSLHKQLRMQQQVWIMTGEHAEDKGERCSLSLQSGSQDILLHRSRCTVL